ncbi:MAG: endonuclease III [Actinomycetota bacterium]|nr:endonuclease III [Actinomycetota bacterium]MCL6092596.1 endonuclease III [Actinomycetota bacterium]MDA8166888.1 endonuclease III [Actinomycetota bacterium]
MITPARLPVIIKRLERHYGRPRWQPRFSPVEELVFTILSQNTTDTNAQRALDSLRDRFPRWQDAASAGERSIAAAIRSGGLADAKARYIKGALAGILAAQGDLSFGFLDQMSDREAITYLTSFTGIGVKTASCVLLFALGRPAMPVDTHVFRVAKRLDFLDVKATRQSAHRILGAITPPDDVYSFHVNLVRHGRQICKAARPRCNDCVIEPLCPSSLATVALMPFTPAN